jgi:hypothetical protein
MQYTFAEFLELDCPFQWSGKMSSTMREIRLSSVIDPLFVELNVTGSSPVAGTTSISANIV